MEVWYIYIKENLPCIWQDLEELDWVVYQTIHTTKEDIKELMDNPGLILKERSCIYEMLVKKNNLLNK